MANRIMQQEGLGCGLLQSGSVVVFDTANLIGRLEPDHAAEKLQSIALALTEGGQTQCIFVWEERGFLWTRSRQETPSARKALDAFAERWHVVFVHGRDEADFVILQLLASIPEAIAVSCDSYSEFHQDYPEIVHSSRVRKFYTIEAAGRQYLSFFGLRKAIRLGSDVPLFAVTRGSTQEVGAARVDASKLNVA